MHKSPLRTISNKHLLQDIQEYYDYKYWPEYEDDYDSRDVERCRGTYNYLLQFSRQQLIELFYISPTLLLSFLISQNSIIQLNPEARVHLFSETTMQYEVTYGQPQEKIRRFYADFNSIKNNIDEEYSNLFYAYILGLTNEFI